MPGRRYSTGSSIVIALTSGRARSASAAYSVVDFPEPVGPVTSRAPVGRVSTCSSAICIENESPISVKVGGFCAMLCDVELGEHLDP